MTSASIPPASLPSAADSLQDLSSDPNTSQAPVPANDVELTPGEKAFLDFMAEAIAKKLQQGT